MIKKILQKRNSYNKTFYILNIIFSKITYVIFNIHHIVIKLYKNSKKNILDIREKSNNLAETNYKNGLYHIENGNISDAIFRFKIIKKFWPTIHNYDAYYKLIFLYSKIQKNKKAHQILDELSAIEDVMNNSQHKKKIDDIGKFLSHL